MSFVCEYCGRSFKRNYNLLYHQKHTRYCLDRRNNPTLGNESSSIMPMPAPIQPTEKAPVATINISEKLIGEFMQTMIKMMQQSTSNNVEREKPKDTINGVLTDAEIRQHLALLTVDLILAGGKGYADYAGGYPFKNRVICTDRARKKLKYMIEEGIIVSDAGGAKLTKRFFQIIGPRNEALINEKYNEIQLQVANIAKSGTTGSSNIVELLEESVRLQTILAEAKAAAEGAENSLTRDFVNHLSRIL